MDRTDEFVSIANLFTAVYSHPSFSSTPPAPVLGNSSTTTTNPTTTTSAIGSTLTIDDYVGSLSRPALSRAIVESIQLRVMLDQNETVLAKLQKL
jgi:hypothetical protein